MAFPSGTWERGRKRCNRKLSRRARFSSREIDSPARDSLSPEWDSLAPDSNPGTPDHKKEAPECDPGAPDCDFPATFSHSLARESRARPPDLDSRPSFSDAQQSKTVPARRWRPPHPANPRTPLESNRHSCSLQEDIFALVTKLRLVMPCLRSSASGRGGEAELRGQVRPQAGAWERVQFVFPMKQSFIDKSRAYVQLGHEMNSLAIGRGAFQQSLAQNP